MQLPSPLRHQAGQGFSGGPVVAEADGRLSGIVFGVLDHGGAEAKRTMYASPMDRALAEIPAGAHTQGP